MKTQWILSVLLASSHLAHAAGGGAGTHGGDMLVSEWVGSALRIAKAIDDYKTESACNGVTGDILRREISATTVQSEFTVSCDGGERDACSDRDTKKTTLSRSRIFNKEDPLNYLTVNLHEYFVLKEIENTNEFTKSQACIQQIQLSGADLSKLRYRINPLTGIIKELHTNPDTYLKCEVGCIPGRCTGSGDNLYLVFAASAFHGDILRETPSGLTEGLTKFGTRTNKIDSWEAGWKVKYDTLTGSTYVSRNYSLYENFVANNLRTPQNKPIKNYTITQFGLAYVNDSVFELVFASKFDRETPLLLAGKCSVVRERPLFQH